MGLTIANQAPTRIGPSARPIPLAFTRQGGMTGECLPNSRVVVLAEKIISTATAAAVTAAGRKIGSWKVRPHLTQSQPPAPPRRCELRKCRKPVRAVLPGSLRYERMTRTSRRSVGPAGPSP